MCENKNADRAKISFENYIKDEYSICREERQYALMLNNILRAVSEAQKKIKNKYDICEQMKFYEIDDKKQIGDILKSCGLKDVVIEKVFYEATFMRDFFERDRRVAYGCNLLKKKFTLDDKKDKKRDTENSFNRKLVDYVLEKEFFGVKKEDVYECVENHYDEHLGSNVQIVNEAGSHIMGNVDEYKQFFEYIKCMMNSKPDIAVIGVNKNKEHVLIFLECKFESGEDKYCKDKSFKIKHHSFYDIECTTCELEEKCKKCKEKEQTNETPKNYCRNCMRCSCCIWTQTNIQNAIGEFIDKNYFKIGSEEGEKTYSKLVRFTRKEIKKDSSNGTQNLIEKDTEKNIPDEILITYLINIENKIWEGKLWKINEEE